MTKKFEIYSLVVLALAFFLLEEGTVINHSIVSASLVLVSAILVVLIASFLIKDNGERPLKTLIVRVSLGTVVTMMILGGVYNSYFSNAAKLNKVASFGNTQISLADLRQQLDSSVKSAAETSYTMFLYEKLAEQLGIKVPDAELTAYLTNEKKVLADNKQPLIIYTAASLEIKKAAIKYKLLQSRVREKVMQSIIISPNELSKRAANGDDKLYTLQVLWRATEAELNLIIPKWKAGMTYEDLTSFDTSKRYILNINKEFGEIPQDVIKIKEGTIYDKPFKFNNGYAVAKYMGSATQSAPQIVENQLRISRLNGVLEAKLNELKKQYPLKLF